jgi:RNA polymerase sigma-70 factor (ECF subfamily)
VTDWRDEVRARCASWTRVSADEAIAYVEAAPSTTYAADLALALGVIREDPAALRTFEELCAPELVSAIRAIDRDPAFVDEVAQVTRVKLLVGEGAKIAGYRGAGPLRAWVAIAARRLAINAKRDAKTGGPVSDDPLAEIVDREPDPELRHLKQLYRGEFRAALAAALAGLPDRARAVLRLRFVDALELAQIGRLYRVHESTASRWITGALDDIATATRAELVARLAVTPETAESVARMVHSGLDLSVARLLQ